MSQYPGNCRYCHAQNTIKKASETSNAIICSNCDALIGFFISPSYLQSQLQSPQEQTKQKVKDGSKNISKLKHQVYVAEQALTKLVSIFSSLNYSNDEINEINNTAAQIFANCSKVWHSNEESKLKSFQIPKDPIVRLSACIICTLQYHFQQKTSTQNLVNMISSYIQSSEPAHDPYSFQNNVYHFLSVMQRFSLHNLTAQPTPNEISIVKYHLQSIEIFNEKSHLFLPPSVVVCIQMFFNNQVMYNVWLPGKGTNLPLCTSIHHILFDQCPLLENCFRSKEELFQFTSQLSQPYIQKTLVHFYLLVLRKSHEEKIFQTKLKSLQTATETIKKLHCPNHSWA